MVLRFFAQFEEGSASGTRRMLPGYCTARASSACAAVSTMARTLGRERVGSGQRSSSRLLRREPSTGTFATSERPSQAVCKMVETAAHTTSLPLWAQPACPVAKNEDSRRRLSLRIRIVTKAA